MFSPGGHGGEFAVDAKPVFFDPSRRRWTGFVFVTFAAVTAALTVFAALSFSIYQDTRTVDVALETRLPTPITAIRHATPEPESGLGETLARIPLRSEPPVEAVLPVAHGATPTPDPAVPVAPVPPPRPQALMPQPEMVLPEPQPILTPSFQYLELGANSGPAPSFVETLIGTLGSLVVSPANATEFVAQTEPRTYAFHVNWSLEGIASLKENILKIDTLLPEWIHVADAEGTLGFDLPDTTQDILAEIANTNPSMRVVPVLTDQHGGAFHPERIAALLADPIARQTLAANTRDYLLAHGLHGVAIRFSHMDEMNAAGFAGFLHELQLTLAGDNLAVYVVLPAEAGLPHVRAISRWVDAIIVEAWGETVSGEAPGPLASQGWFDRMAADWQAVIPAERLVFAIRNIAYDWGAEPVAEQIGTLDALNRARIAGQPVRLDAETLNTHFTYQSAEGEIREVWMLDGISAHNQIHTLMRTAPRGLALMRLGNEDSTIWDLLAAPSRAAPAMLEHLDYSTQITRQGSGEIIKVVHTPQSGTRRVTASATGLITEAFIEVFPRAYEIAHWGSDDLTLIALTFDDGPDPVYTAAILDILAQHDVPASFFATGAQMTRHPDLVRRILAEGHEVGSHTYSHINISRMTPEMLRLDLNATQRVFESITGRNLLLFRAPYAVDANPQVATEIAPLATVGELGYLTVNMNIDPKDWWAPDADRILTTTLRQVDSGLGNIVLLHDAGGNRSQTVAALPGIIDGLRARGYRFVTASELIGLSPNDVMPFSQRPASFVSVLEGAGFALLRFGEITLMVAFLIAIILGLSRAVILIVLAALRKRPSVRLRPIFRGPRVGIIVPAYNEEKVIAQTIRSLLASSYQDYEILIVDDGSKDETVAVCEREFGADPRVRIFTKPNGGKSSALNFGFTRTDADIVIALDADTIFDPHAIGWLAARFAESRIGAVAGNIKVGNRNNLLTRWQATEYITAQNLDRRAFELLNCITVVPGAIGAWRREAVVAVGGYTSDTLAEDADLTIRLLRAGYRVAYEERAIAFTEAPETPRQLYKQRFRWMFGMLQTAVKHRDALLMRDSKSVALIALPHILIFQILFSLLAPVADIVAVIALGDLTVKLLMDSNAMGTGQVVLFLALFFSFILLDFLTGVMAFRLEKNEDWRLLLWVPLQRFYYRQLLYIVALKALLTAMRGTLVGWGNITRNASVTYEEKPAIR